MKNVFLSLMNCRTLFLLFLFSMAVSVGGCATMARQYIEPPEETMILEPGHSRIYLIRNRQLGGAAVPTQVFHGDEHIGMLTPGAYFVWDTEPGHYCLSLQCIQASLSFTEKVTDADGKTQKRETQYTYHDFEFTARADETIYISVKSIVAFPVGYFDGFVMDKVEGEKLLTRSKPAKVGKEAMSGRPFAVKYP